MIKNADKLSATAFLFLIFCLASQSFAGAWTQKKRGMYLKFSVNYLRTGNEFDYKGREVGDFGYTFEKNPLVREPSFRDFTATVYFEYGLTEQLTLVSKLPFKSLTSRRDESIGAGEGTSAIRVESITSGFSDLQVSLRYRLLEAPFIFSLEGGVKIPLGYKKPAETGTVLDLDDNEEDDRAPLGTGREDAEIMALFGKSLFPIPVYITGGIGYRQRAGTTFHDEIIYNAEVGVTFGRFLVKTYWDGLRNTNRPIPDKNALQPDQPLTGGEWVDFNVGDVDVMKISPSIIFDFNKNLDLQAEFLHILSGKNTVSGDMFSFGVIFKK
ncbi:MAG: hypothetical protein ACE5I1_25990 [bacterium]